MTTEEINRRARALGSRFRVVEYDNGHMQIEGPKCVYEKNRYLEREANAEDVLYFFYCRGYDLEGQRRLSRPK